MTSLIRLTAVASVAALAFAAAACTPAETEADNTPATDTTTIIEREVPADPVIIEREVPADPVVVQDDNRGDTTTVRAGENGVEVETTNR
ncbi:MAG: hypothetical protein KKG14_01250 [Alphaproteobacteria bacterium]|nr:hypothetical protein [Alphaproteobacteria bacterium]MBU2272290.1 hypothetical protein [Alphaproteobacteria bacterium]MBU2417314.1 hypothetical protein [Alphaproteobacteria bacterium]